MGDFRGQKRPFWVLLEFESNDLAENLSKDSSNGLATFFKLHYGLQISRYGAHSTHSRHSIPSPGSKKIENFFFAFFLRIESFWLQKSNKKNLTRFLPLWGHASWDLEYFWKISKFQKKKSFFFFELNHSESKKTKKIFWPDFSPYEVTWSEA